MRKNLNALVSRWIEDRGKYGDAWEELDKLVRDEPTEAFRVIALIQNRLTDTEEPNYPLLGLLAAGHLEDLLSEHGEGLIEDVEHLAKQDPEFRKCLSGVWQNAMSDQIYSRVQKASDRTFRFS